MEEQQSEFVKKIKLYLYIILCIYVKRGKEIPQLPTEHRYSVQFPPQEFWVARILYDQEQQS